LKGEKLVKKLKVIVAALLILTMFLSLVGCGDEKVQDASNNTETEQRSDEKKDRDKDAYQKDADLNRSLLVENGIVKFQIDIPTGWVGGLEGTGWGYIDIERELYVIYDTYLTKTSNRKYKVDLDKIIVAEHVLDEMKGQFLYTGMRFLPSSEGNDFEIIKKDNVKINGWKMCRYEGNFLLAEDTEIELKDKKAYFVAYSLIMDGCPIYFVVVDKSDSQNQSALVGQLADKIAKTFREYEKKQ